MAQGMARVRLMPRLLGLAAAAVASLVIAQSALAQGAPQSVPANLYGFNGSVMVDGAPADGATIMATAGDATSSATWDSSGWVVEVPANTDVTFTVNGNAATANGAASITSGDQGSLTPVRLEASTTAMPADEDAMPSEGDEGEGEGDTLQPSSGTAMSSDGDEADTLQPSGGTTAPAEGDAMPSEESAMPSGGTGGLLSQGSGSTAWVLGLSGSLIALGLLGVFAARRRESSHTA